MRFKTSTLAIVIVFVLSTGILVALVGATFSQIRIQDDKTYSAVFSDASGLATRVDVRGAGVAIGSVKSIKRRDQGGVLISFTVPKHLQITEATQARIRYANLTGDRYLEVAPGESGEQAAALPANSTIPESRTKPALELDDLFAGFDPLMQALSPEDVNELTSNILGVTEGDSGAVKSMLGNVGSFTAGLAERDQLIGSIIDELSKTLSTFDTRRDEFDKVIVGLKDLTHQVANDREVFADSLVKFSSLGTDIADFLTAIRPGLKTNLDQVAVAAEQLNDHEVYVRSILSTVKFALNRAGRLGGNASQFNFFLCGLRVRIAGEGSEEGVLSPALWASDDRCKKGAN